MATPTFVDLDQVNVEHMVSDRTGEPLVKVSAVAGPVVALGQLTPDQARQIAGHLLESAARAEYEVDLIAGLTAFQAAHPDGDPAWLDMMLAVTLGAVRSGEIRRHTTAGGDR